MPQNLDEATGSWDSPLTTFGDVEDLNGANFKTHGDKISRRLKLLYDMLISPTATGAVKIRRYLTLAALKAVNPGTAGFIDGDIVVVAGSEFQGVYQYVSPAAHAEDLPWIAVPTVGTGRWFHAMYDHRPKSAGAVSSAIAGSFTTASGSYVDVTNSSIQVFDGKAGDILEVEASGACSHDVAANIGELQLHITDGAPTVFTPNGGYHKHQWASGGINIALPFAVAARLVLAATGTVTAKLQARTPAANFAVDRWVIRARVIKDS